MNRIEAIFSNPSSLEPCCRCQFQERCNRYSDIIDFLDNPGVVAACGNINSPHYQERIQTIGNEK